MSGPKKSRWEIEQERKAKREEERRKRRQKQIDDIKASIDDIREQLNHYEEIINIDRVKQNVENWIRDIESSFNGDLREAYRGLKGIKNYIKNQRLKQRATKEIKLNEERLLFESKIKTVVENLEAVESDFSDILNDAIKDRIKLFKDAISQNPDNPNTLKQIKEFKSQLYKMQTQHQEHQEDLETVADAFGNILQADIIQNDNAFEIAGDINGVPIKVKLNKQDNNIDFDTPMDSGCKGAMETITQKLSELNIDLGEIKVIKTGQILNSNRTNKNRQRIKQ